MKRSKVIGALEIGTSKIVVLVGETTGKGSIEIIGSSVCSSRGVTKGEIIDFKAVSDCAHTAIVHAEQEAGQHIRTIFLSQTGRHLDSFYNEATVTVMSQENVVSRDDMLRVVAEAKSKELSPDRLYIHHIRNPFRLDDRLVADPLGMTGEKLQVGYWNITGDRNKIRDHVGIVNGIGMQVGDMIISSLASGVMVASQEEKRQGVLVLDIGSGTSDFVVYRDNHVVCCGVIPVGGDHLTNDLSLGLRINRKHAENLKVECGKAFVDMRDADDKVWSVGDKAIGDRRIPVKAIQKIINSRLEELFQILHKRVSEHVRLSDLPAGVLLTGGTSRLIGIDQVAANELGVPVRRGEHPDWVGREISGPEYSTALGLFHYALTASDRDDEKEEARRPLLSKLFSMKR